MVNLITTDSYFNLFNVLTDNLKDVNNINGKRNLIFCEEKISLLVERSICNKFNGSFNTDVYSFGNFLRVNLPLDKVLTVEGSNMVIRRILSKLTLSTFKKGTVGIEKSFYRLIGQFKSAKISTQDILVAKDSVEGVLKSKLDDIYNVYSEYEKYISENHYEDSASLLDKLPSVLENSDLIKNSNVYIVGFTNGFTAQIKNAVLSILRRSESVTAIFTKGDNTSGYLNESQKVFTDLCLENNIKFNDLFVKTKFCDEGQFIASNLFDPSKKITEKIKTDKIKVLRSSSVKDEVLKVAEDIKSKIYSKKCRYKDFCVTVSDLISYEDDIVWAFDLLEIPYFLDSKRKVYSNPLVSLINSYIDIFKTNYKRDHVISFICNPLVLENKEDAEKLSDYLIKYSINRQQIKEPFTLFDSSENLEYLNGLREQVCSLLDCFDVNGLLVKGNVKSKLEKLSDKLRENGYEELASINDHIFDAVTKILTDVGTLLYGVTVSYKDLKEIFNSGILALELSILPEYNDAVFIGDFKSSASALSKYSYCLGLDSSVPAVKEDISMLSDTDIALLENIKILVEPKIRIVNRRSKENVLMTLASFTDELNLSYSTSGIDGKKKERSEIFDFILNSFTTKRFSTYDGYLTIKQGFKSFAYDCGLLKDRSLLTFDNQSAYYNVAYSDKLNHLLDMANKKIVERVNNADNIYGKFTSPTTIESFYECPYKTFMDRGLALKEKDNGNFDVRLIGTFSHAVYSDYFANLNRVVDRESSDKLVEEILSEKLKKTENKRFYNDAKLVYTVEALKTECKNFCYRNFLLLKTSSFKPNKDLLEVKFGVKRDENDNVKFPPIPLLDGKINLVGTIDRVDTDGDYVRVIDYKTGGVSEGLSKLYNGTKLQLYLYSLPLKDKKIAGLYYVKVGDKFLDPSTKPSLVSGVTLDDMEVILRQDSKAENNESEFFSYNESGNKIAGVFDEETINGLIEYAKTMCENGAKNLTEGFIKPTPVSGTCEYCKYKSICGNEDSCRDTASKLTANQIVDTLKEEK